MGFGFQQEQNGKFVLAEIIDPVAKAAYVIDDQDKVAHKFALADPPERKTPAAASTTAAKPPPCLERTTKSWARKISKG